ncbi:rRNA maturation RNase YbeY [Anaerococcus sp. mt242]|uniref:rRNA maturation RNase YbeY n=1 Tax=unclassified Anaerococcus TaxID=2614126 RepID=UPI001933B220|nr:rRNA maturation RNase YbeY [Anaerococcus sp. mt242]MBM0045565.1 rRNA maturation RNase YbeY [Anaerococcus sp. mt242]
MNLIIANETNEKIDMDEKLKSVVKTVLETEGLPLEYEVSITFVDIDEIHKLNKEFRNVDRPTDVLSFPMDEDFSIEGVDTMLGDIVISMDVAKEQAKDFGHSLDREIMYLTAHSMLHLLGYDHMEDEEKSEMRAREKEVMKKLGVFKND